CAYQERIGQSSDALVSGADDAGAARAAARRLSGGATASLPDAGSGPAAASGGGVERRCWMALRAGGSTDERGDYLDARRSGASLDYSGAGPACGHVAIDLCAEIQRDGWGIADGIPDAMAHAAGWG